MANFDSLKRRIKKIPLLGSLLRWLYTVIKAPAKFNFLFESITDLKKQNVNYSVYRPCCYLGNDTALTKVHDFKMLVNTKDICITPHLIMDGFWEMHITELFESIVKEGFTVVDIGANMGYYTLIAALRVGKKGKVYAFEPEPKSFDILCKNIEINGFNNTVITCQKALLDRDGKVDFNVYEEHVAGSSIFVDNSIFGSEPHKKRSISVQATTLDAFLGNNVKVDLIKMDAEGAEPFIFKGMKNVIKNSSNLKIIMEFAPTHIEATGESPRNFLQSLKNAGFKIMLIDRYSRKLSEIEIEPLLKCEIEDLFLDKVI